MLKITFSFIDCFFICYFPDNGRWKNKGTYIVGSVGVGAMNDIRFAPSLGGGLATFDPDFSGEIGIGYDFGNIRTDLTYSQTTTPLTET